MNTTPRAAAWKTSPGRRRPTFCGFVVVLATSLVPQLVYAANPPECSYYTKKDLEWCSIPDIYCTQYETWVVAPSCEGMPKTGCCSGDYRVFCNEEGSTLCAADCTNPWSSSPCRKSTSGTASCSGLPIKPGDALDCAVVPACACGDQECGVGPCLNDCGACPADRPVCTFDGKCVECAPKCGGKACGPDGCGAQCGPCPGGQVCVETTGACCAPDCGGKSCGPDGCGGSCGSCAGDAVCTADGSCAPLGPGCTAGSGPGCGCDCEGCVCVEDPFCCSVTWDALCSVECAACGGDCPKAACIPNCAGVVCGDHDGCGGSCGSCPEGTFCGKNGGKCLPCTCENRECGDDGCGDPCGSCLGSKSCYKGQCVQRGCAEASGAGCDGCPCEECVCALDPYCCDVQWDLLCAQHCTMKCGVICPCVQECGDRECGFSICEPILEASNVMKCGTCTKPEVCMPDGWCCAPSCEGKECGSDGCYDFCGECGPNEVCAQGKCVCIPNCWEKECGSNGCGDPDGCGVCAAGEFCAEGTCAAPYPASCLGPERPSAPDCPAVIGGGGCCDSDGRAVWCSEGSLYCEDCPSCSQVCGPVPVEGEALPSVPGAQRCIPSELGVASSPPLACAGCWVGCPPGTLCNGGQCVGPEDAGGGEPSGADSAGADATADTSGPDAAGPDAAGDDASVDPDSSPPTDPGPGPADAASGGDGAPRVPDATADLVTPVDAPHPGADSTTDAPPQDTAAATPDGTTPTVDAAPGQPTTPPGDVAGSCGGCRTTSGPPVALVALLALALARRRRPVR